MNPSIALKFLRSGLPSGNQFGMVELENGPAGQWDFFNDNFRTHLPNFKNNEQEVEQTMCRKEEVDEMTGESFFIN